MHAITAPSQAKAAPSSTAADAARVTVQAKCECGAPALAAQETCSACGTEAPLQLQAALLPGHDFARIRVKAATPSDSLAGRGDPLEVEADRTAEQVLRRLAALPAPAAGAAPVAQPPLAAGSPLQRQLDPDEEEADAMAEAALAGPKLEGAPPGEDTGSEEDTTADDDSGEPVQAAADGSASVTPGLRASIERTRGGGHTLPPALRTSLENAFGADFSGVRIHADAGAAALAHSIHARAFATGRDIYFGAGHYDPGSEAGRRLLAHELTHVLQQGAAPSNAPLARAPMHAVQCEDDPAPPKKSARKQIGQFHYFDGKGDSLQVSGATQTEELGIPPGYFEVTIKAIGGGAFEVNVKTVGLYEIHPKNPGAYAQLLGRAKRIFLLVYGAPGTGKTADPKDKPSADDPTGRAGPAGEKTEQKPGATQEGGGDKPGEKKAEGKEQGTEEGKTEGNEEGKEEGKGGAGLGGDKGKGGGLPGKKKGSKFGVFGLLDLPQPLVEFMEGALEVLGDSAEMEAMSESLRMLKDLADNRTALAELFKDSDTLIEIALGLKDNAAITAIETWVNKEVKPSKAGKAKHKGVAKLAAKLVATAAKLRKVLKPVFKIRAAVQSALAGVGLLLEAVPAVQTLLDMVADPSKLSALDIEAAADDVAVDFAAQLKLKLDFAPKALKAGIEKFSEADLVSYEELAAAVTAAVLAAVPKPYKPIVKVGKELGIDSAIADNVIAPLIPKEALDGVNGALRSLVTLVKPTLESGADTLQKIIDELAPGFLAELPPELRKIVKPSRHGRGLVQRSSARALARMVRQSGGAPMDEDTRSAAETSMGMPFGDVRVHTDGAAAQASEHLGANAFAIGSDVYFGPGKFAPDTQAGRRLLYHELAHTAQQQGGPAALQPDYKELLKKLAKRFSTSVIAELRGATTKSADKQKRITEIQDQVSKIVGRKVESRTSPKLPTGYMYIPKDKGKIKTIRRTLQWIRFLPALTIDAKTRRIKLAATLEKFDPKAPMRRALRASLGCSGKQEAHHIIPLELYFNPAVKTARANGFAFNGADNGLCISENIHAGSHPKYTAGVESRLKALTSAYGSDWSKLQKPFLSLVDDLRSDLKKRRSKLK